MLPRKSLGQHFLKNPSLLKKLVEYTELKDNDAVVEIGAGQGDLTQILIQRAKYVYAFELDAFLYDSLRQKFSAAENLKLCRGDFLKARLQDLQNDAGRKLRIIANIPYKITAPLLTKFVKEKDAIEDCFILMQREVAERLNARTSTHSYGSLSVLVQSYFKIDILKFVKSGSFAPPPKVESAFVKLIPLQIPAIKPELEGELSRFLRFCFSKRRKTIKNILAALNVPEFENILNLLEIPRTARPEEFSPSIFAKLTEAVSKSLQNR